MRVFHCRDGLLLGLLSSILLVPTLGCGPEEERPESNEVTQFLEARNELVARAFCQMPFNCDGRPVKSVSYTSANQCLNTVDFDAPAFRGGDLLTAWQEGRLSFHPNRADECLSTFESRLDQGACIEVTPQLNTIGIDACERTLTGTVQAGQPCQLDRQECGSGLSCVHEDSSKCYGICRKPGNKLKIMGEKAFCGQPDQICNPDKPLICAPVSTSGDRKCLRERSLGSGAECYIDEVCQDGFVCAQNKCQRFSMVGQGETCDQQIRFCKAGLTCRDISGGGEDELPEGTCKSFSTKNEKCRSTLECAEGLYCKVDTANTEGTCKERLDPGDECTPGACGAGTTCKPLPSSGRSVCQFSGAMSCDLP